ncbi:uncharacterized protein LOC119967021 [Scyliorhinus canicula]|uniref:uncharacterized protein LOC119967021 n=1 Tax=Scyliorhinus canicula TaxID=7830 RepID=UPI0018F4DA43|nr:uncharacterized protein LOC119967021 [Scyliorhinus canicula]
MLRIFLTVSVLFWNQLAAEKAVNEVIDFCQDADCLEPVEAILGKNYNELEFDFRQWIATDAYGDNIQDAVDFNLMKFFNYSRCGNVADTIVPISAPWGFRGYLENGTVQQIFKVYTLIVPQVNDPPEPLDPTVKIGIGTPIWFYTRSFDHSFHPPEVKELVTQFMGDLEKDNQPFNRTTFIIAVFNTLGLMEIGFEKIEQ